jgi:hypothetical protein
MPRDPFDEARPQIDRARELTQSLLGLKQHLVRTNHAVSSAERSKQHATRQLEVAQQQRLTGGSGFEGRPNDKTREALEAASVALADAKAAADQTESELKGARRDAQICLTALGRCGRALHDDARNLRHNLVQCRRTLTDLQVEASRRGLEQSIRQLEKELSEREAQVRQLESAAYALGHAAGVSVGTTAFAGADDWHVPGAGNRSAQAFATAHHAAASTVHGSPGGTGLRGGSMPDPELVRDALEAARGRPRLRRVPAAADVDAFGGRRSVGHRPDRWSLGSQESYARSENVIVAGVEAWWRD